MGEGIKKMPACAITPTDITSADWSLMLDANSQASAAASGAPMAGSGIGNVVQGITDINQCIGIIMSTPKGSDPLRPRFACDLWRWIDKPLTVARPGIVREMVEAVTIWEPRVRLLSVVVTAQGISQLLIALTWRLKVDTTGLGNQRLTLTVPRNLA
jgi:phage baseplate assembly protein W